MIIKDLIIGEVLEISDTMLAVEEAERRVNIHNSDFDYSHNTGHHYPVGAELIVNNSTIIIRRKKKC